MELTPEERTILAEGGSARALALRVVADTARLMGARRLVPIVHAHIDGCVHFADAGVLFTERLVALGGRVAVPASLNVGSLDLVRAGVTRQAPEARAMARRLMDAFLALGCEGTWTCAPYQAGHRPGLGDQIAWAESNAIVFANSVLGARTNRYGDFFDICAALAGRAPHCGLHLDENRRARVLVDLRPLPEAVLRAEDFPAVLGAWLGRAVGGEVAAIAGLPDPGEDGLKALCAASASTGAVGLLHVIGVTPEAPDMQAAFGGAAPEAVLAPTLADLRAARDRLTAAPGAGIDCVALGSPHFSEAECRALARLAEGRRFRVPVYVCTRMGVLAALGEDRRVLEAAGAEFVIGTCVVVAPVLRQASGVLMTNSAKFAHYAEATTGHRPVFGPLADCVASAEAGRVVREAAPWN